MENLKSIETDLCTSCYYRKSKFAGQVWLRKVGQVASKKQPFSEGRVFTGRLDILRYYRLHLSLKRQVDCVGERYARSCLKLLSYGYRDQAGAGPSALSFGTSCYR